MGDASGLLWVVAVILVIVGMAGTILPALPGTPLVFLGLLVGAWADGFQKVGWVTLVLLGILTAASLAVDFLATSMGAKRVGASVLAVVGAAIGTVAGLFLGIPGLILGPFIGAVIGEYISRRDLRQAGKVGLGTWLGLVLGSAAKLALTFLMIGLFVAAYFL